MAEVLEKETITIKLDFAYTVILGNRPGERIGLVKLDETGYFPARGYDCATDTIEEAKERVKELNDRIGDPSDVADSASIGSLFGWNVPGAQAARNFFTISQDSQHGA